MAYIGYGQSTVGGNGAGTTTFNGAGGSRLYGGAMASSITIEELGI